MIYQMMPDRGLPFFIYFTTWNASSKCKLHLQFHTSIMWWKIINTIRKMHSEIFLWILS